MATTIDFDFDDLQLAKKTVRVNKQDYVLTEADTNAGTVYKNACLKATKLSDGKVSGMDGMADAEPLLLSYCLYVADAAGNMMTDDKQQPMRVPLSVIKTWKNRITKKLFDWVKEVSELHEKDDPAEIRKDIERLQKRLKEIEEKNSPAKNEPSD